MRRLVLVGPPGCGKGTQAERLTKDYGFEYLATGDIFREMLRRDTPLSREVRKYVNAGKLVPDELVWEVVKTKIEDLERGAGFGYILDGFPRTIKQAELYDAFVASRGGDYRVLYIEVPEAELVRRISGRRICEKCGAVYHVENKPPKREGVCDICGGRLYQREDDREDVVRERIKVYWENTAPLIDFYLRKGFLIKVDGVGTIDEVYDRIRKGLAGWLKG